MKTIYERLAEIERLLCVLVERQQVREWYGTDQVAEQLGRSAYTVREWCRKRRINAEKKASGRGGFASWAVSHIEVLRVRREGLLPSQRSAGNDTTEGDSL